MADSGKSKSGGGGAPNTSAEQRLAEQRAQRNAEKHDTSSYMTKAQKEKIEALEAKIVNRKTEKAYVVDENGKIILESKRGSSNSTRLDFQPFNNYSDAVLTHNHPMTVTNARLGRDTLSARIGTPFSGQDLKTASYQNLKGIRARSNDYEYSFSRGKNGWGGSYRDIEKTYNNAVEKAFERYANKKGLRFDKQSGSYVNQVIAWYAQSKASSGKEAMTLFTRIMNTAIHQGNKAVAKEYGLRYTRKKVGG